MKTTVKQIATGTFIAILLMLGNVNATELKSSIRESIEIEAILQIENWMLNDMVWNTNSINIAESVLETEPGMELESWMINAEMWNFNNIFVEETETAMELENWMTNDATWNSVNNDNEPKLTVENWMVNESIWEQVWIIIHKSL